MAAELTAIAAKGACHAAHSNRLVDDRIKLKKLTNAIHIFHAGPAQCINNQNVGFTYNVISPTLSCYVQNTNTALRYGSYVTEAILATSCCPCSNTQLGCPATLGFCVIPATGLTAAGGTCQATAPSDPTLLIGYNTGTPGTNHVTVCGCTN
jgi:hypothetical protein